MGMAWSWTAQSASSCQKRQRSPRVHSPRAKKVHGPRALRASSVCAALTARTCAVPTSRTTAVLCRLWTPTAAWARVPLGWTRNRAFSKPPWTVESTRTAEACRWEA